MDDLIALYKLEIVLYYVLNKVILVRLLLIFGKYVSIVLTLYVLVFK